MRSQNHSTVKDEIFTSVVPNFLHSPCVSCPLSLTQRIYFVCSLFLCKLTCCDSPWKIRFLGVSWWKTMKAVSVFFTHKRTNHAFFNASIYGPILARICWYTNKGETVSLSADNDITKYNVIRTKEVHRDFWLWVQLQKIWDDTEPTPVCLTIVARTGSIILLSLHSDIYNDVHIMPVVITMNLHIRVCNRLDFRALKKTRTWIWILCVAQLVPGSNLDQVDIRGPKITDKEMLPSDFPSPFKGYLIHWNDKIPTIVV